MDNLLPYTPIHPGEILKDELISRNITQKHFTQLIGVPYTMLNEILNSKRPMSAEFCLLLEASLNIKAYIWVNLQAEYNLQIARRDSRNISRFNAVRGVCASLL